MEHGVFLCCVSALLATLTAQISPTSQACGPAEKADVVFLLDASGSEGRTNFGKQLTFVSNFVNSFHVDPQHVQFSVVTFSSRPYNQFFLNTYHSKAEIEAAMMKIPYSAGATNTGAALQYVHDNTFYISHGARSDARRYAIILTDGRSSNPAQTVQQAKRLKDDLHVEIIAIGIGGTNIDELTNIASGSQHVFTAPSFDALASLQAEIKQATCVNGSSTIPPCFDDPHENCTVVTFFGGCTNTNPEVRKVVLKNCPHTCDLCSELYYACHDQPSGNCNIMHKGGLCHNEDRTPERSWSRRARGRAIYVVKY